MNEQNQYKKLNDVRRYVVVGGFGVVGMYYFEAFGIN